VGWRATACYPAAHLDKQKCATKVEFRSTRRQTEDLKLDPLTLSTKISLSDRLVNVTLYNELLYSNINGCNTGKTGTCQQAQALS